MEVRGVNDFSTAFIYPDLFQDSLTVGAVTIAVGIVGYLHVPAILVLNDGKSKSAALAFHDGVRRFLLSKRRREERGKLLPSKPESQLYLYVSIMPSHSIRRADSIGDAIRSKVNINKGGIKRFVSKNFFDGKQVCATSIKMSTKDMPEGMAGNPFVPPSSVCATG